MPIRRRTDTALSPVKSRRKPLIIGLAIALVLVVGGVIAWWLGHRSDDDPTTVTKTNTATVQRGSLAAGFKLSGTIGYGDAEPLSGASTGIVTKVPKAGQMIDAGQVIMEVEGAPVFLLQGDLPLWRVVGPGVTGLDVENLRQSLERVGIAAGSGQTYDATLSAAIAALYTNAGYAEPVALAEDQAIQESAREAVQQAQSAVQQAQAALSAAQNARPSESDLLTAQQSIDQAKVVLSMAQQGVCTANGNQVPCTPEIIAYYQNAVNLAVAQYQQLSAPPDTSAQQQAVNQAQEALNQAQTAYNQTLQNTAGPQNILIVPEPKIRIDEVDATVGQPATGEVLTWTKTILYGEAPLTAAQQRMLTTGTQAVLEWGDGSTMTGSVAEITDSSRDSLTGQETPATVRVDVTDQAKLAEHGPSAVTLSFIEDEAEDTLIVPVTALVVPAEGGYCVERPDGSYVRVEIGLVADTRVQVFSDQLREGDLVVTP